MFIYRSHGRDGFCLTLKLKGRCYDLSAASPVFGDISTFLSAADPVGAVREILPAIEGFLLEEDLEICAPVDKQEVWASGVTYLRSKVARMEESAGSGDFYDLVYEAERPELFFKSTAQRVVGPGKAVRMRRDSTWNVPEPELVLVLSSKGQIVGYTIGNDMSSRSIEGENPLYLPQAKVYDGSCAIGPGILINDGEKLERAITMSIAREGAAVFSGETSTGQIRRPLQQLADYLFREMSFPEGAFLLTGTGIVPPDDFTLHTGDVVSISIEGIGTLENPVA